MAVHVGQLLKQLHAWSGLRVDRFAAMVSYDIKTVYYHFGRSSLSTGIIDRYDEGFRKAGWEIDIYGMLSRMARGLPPIPEGVEPPLPDFPGSTAAPSLAAEAWPGYGRRPAKADRDEQVALLLSQAAHLLRQRGGGYDVAPNENEDVIRRRADRGDQAMPPGPERDKSTS